MNLLRVLGLSLALSFTLALLGQLSTAYAQPPTASSGGADFVGTTNGTGDVASLGMSVTHNTDTGPRQKLTVDTVAVVYPDGSSTTLTEGVDYVVVHNGSTKPVIYWDSILVPDKNHKIWVWGTTGPNDLPLSEIDLEHL